MAYAYANTPPLAAQDPIILTVPGLGNSGPRHWQSLWENDRDNMERIEMEAWDAPVRTLWSREDDIRGGYYRPMHLHTARIGFDDQGRVTAWDHVIVGQSIVGGTPFEPMMVKDGIDATAVEGMKEPYDLPMRLTVHHPKLNVPVLWWRSVGSTHTAFVMETLVDEIARATKQDPVAYRMKLIGAEHPRHRAALQLAVDRSGYGQKKLPALEARSRARDEFDTLMRMLVGPGQVLMHPLQEAALDSKRRLHLRASMCSRSTWMATPGFKRR